ncbi:hypothetical protein AB205_0170850 [Aquarana catesbeiana]|uniref:Uncharacterized protein n=1 Tax=Aquarana catesbeiana TaxID=8400 RepID=A0A2G9S5W4_AQUCT|nr:hypothetical protein AB205_0170850 [Aquarana catesbeiana]
MSEAVVLQQPASFARPHHTQAISLNTSFHASFHAALGLKNYLLTDEALALLHAFQFTGCHTAKRLGATRGRGKYRSLAN